MRNYLVIPALILVITTCATSRSTTTSDTKATKETVNLYNNMKKLTARGFMFGHQDALAYGVNWKYESDRSDVKDVTGDYPAIYGWELGHLEIGSDVNLDSVPFDKMKLFIKEAYLRGGVITISWHGNNPMTGKTAWDPAPGTVASILPGGEKNAVFNAQLDKIADFMLSLKGDKGELIPVLFRPFHEHTGGWFWWGNATTSDEEYKSLFRYTFNYLMNTRQVHNLLYVYNTGTEFSNAEQYLQRYPGDDVVDMLSFDTYQFGDASGSKEFTESLDRRLSVIEKIAAEKNKIFMIGEVGYNQIPDENWWTKTLLPGIGSHKIAYVLLWRNAGFKHKEKTVEYYAPYKGQLSEKDFIEFYNLPQTLFQQDITYKEMYQ
jgi:hypothetical protein